ncbi:hypothetical protein CPB84DRAFT_227263 [Gymnopilus junonius]|uniref:Uncharacterized protein n=1 Tax=Gymnopilus junonius TaxID=109634 RepID=A0A9P5NCJ6_GYMJU|nr:hypothetical protein CPB84DRAFT_227263 [Gymnopilus junonius]
MIHLIGNQMARNKLRLYIAYYQRLPSPRQPEKYHTSFILMPKMPKTDSPKSAIVYHVTNPLDVNLLKAVWKFEPKNSLPRTGKLTGLMLLAKIPPEIGPANIEDILNQVPLKQDDDSWWCHNWVCNRCLHSYLRHSYRL